MRIVYIRDIIKVTEVMSLSISIKIFFKRLKKTYFAGDVNDVSYNPFPKSYDKFKLYNKNPK